MVQVPVRGRSRVGRPFHKANPWMVQVVQGLSNLSQDKGKRDDGMRRNGTGKQYVHWLGPRTTRTASELAGFGMDRFGVMLDQGRARMEAFPKTCFAAAG
jgi:hypothetical protein